MKYGVLHAKFITVLLLGITLFAASHSGPAQTANKTQTSPSGVAATQRANRLLSQMSVEEKIGQLTQYFKFAPNPAMEKQIAAGQVGSLLFVTDPAEINRLQKLAVEGSRLHIPLIFGLDVIHGFKTIFPVPIAMAASWDPALIEKAQGFAAAEARSAGIHWTFGPMVDIARDPRWGRMVEGAGEDPYLGSAVARAQVRGFQGSYLGAPNHIVACAKHYAGYGAAEGGRDYDSSDISDDQLYNVYLPPFHSAVEAGTGTLMSAYMDLNGVPATGNKWLLHDVLREQWKFKGFVVSDANAVKSLEVHGFAKDAADAAVRALTAGVNMEMAFGDSAYSKHLAQALKEGRVTSTQIDDAVRPILETKIRLGLFEHPYVDVSAAKQNWQDPEHKTEARIAGERSAVLLRNGGNILPLKAQSYPRVAVIGPLADSKPDVTGSWAFANDLTESVTLLAGLRNVVPKVEFSYAPGVQIARKIPSPFADFFGPKPPTPWTSEEADAEIRKAVQLAKDSDAAIMVLGEAQDMSGEAASRSMLELPGREQELLEAVVATGKPVVLVLLSGRPLNIKWASQHVPAILEAWYPGAQGGEAVANLLYGKGVPGGKLPFTWPRTSGQVPIFLAHNTTHEPQNQGKRYWDEESTPLFPFGFGLSYTRFEYSNLRVKNPSVKKGAPVNLSLDLENTGDLAADEVVQLYIHQKYGTSSRPVRELKGFERVSLAPHEKKTIEFTLTPRDLTYWSSATHSWVQDVAPFDVWVGGDSTATLHSNLTVSQ
jgi:beta-glucosidase